MDVKNIHIAKIVGLTQYKSELEARLELEYLHTLTNQQLYTIGEEFGEDGFAVNIRVHLIFGTPRQS